MGIKYSNDMGTDFVVLRNFSDFKNYSSRGVLSFISLHKDLILFQSSIKVHYSNCLNHSKSSYLNKLVKTFEIHDYLPKTLRGIGDYQYKQSLSN